VAVTEATFTAKRRVAPCHHNEARAGVCSSHPQSTHYSNPCKGVVFFCQISDSAERSFWISSLPPSPYQPSAPDLRYEFRIFLICDVMYQPYSSSARSMAGIIARLSHLLATRKIHLLFHIPNTKAKTNII
jgi:hypothetical protein